MKLAISVNDYIKTHWLEKDDAWVYENQRSPYRFIKSAIDIFGLDDVALISPKDFNNDSNVAKISNVYFFNKDLKFISSKQQEFSCDVLFYLDDNGFLPDFKLKDLEMQHAVYRALLNKGNIGHMINTIESKEKNNKAKFPEFVDFPMPNTYSVKSVEELESILQKEKELVAKHIFGSDSTYVKLLSIHDKDYFEKLRSYESVLDEWIFQQKIDIYSELRMVFLDGDIVGTREIVNREKPWGVDGSSSEKAIRRTYVPDKSISLDTLKIAKDLDMEFGCVDWIKDRNGKRLFLEANDAGTGLNPTDDENNYIYDITRTVPEYIFNKYFS